MNTRLMSLSKLVLIVAIVSGCVIYAVGMFIPKPTSPSLDHDKLSDLIGGGMPPNLMTPKPNSTTTESFDELMALVRQTVDPEEWIVAGKCTHLVKNNDLMEVDESEGEYVLAMQLCWRQQALATQERYFISYHGKDQEIEDRPFTFLACGMNSYGFLSGRCECTAESRAEVVVSPDWTFDNKESNVMSEFNRGFIATIGGIGEIDCGNDATIKWRFNEKATEPSVGPKPR